MGGNSDFEGPRRMKIIVGSISELVSVPAQCHTLDRHLSPAEVCLGSSAAAESEGRAPGSRGDLTAGTGGGRRRRVRAGRPGAGEGGGGSGKGVQEQRRAEEGQGRASRRRGGWRRVREGHPGGTSARQKAQSGHTQCWSRNQGRCWAVPMEVRRAPGRASAAPLWVAGPEPIRDRPEQKPFPEEESRGRSVTPLLSHREGAFTGQVLRG